MNKEQQLQILGSEDNLLSRLVHHIDKTFLKNQQEYLNKLNVSHTQSLIIIYLGFHQTEPTYQYMLEKAFGLTNPTVTTSIKSMMKKDILYREKDENDGRYYRLFLTDYGKTLIDPCIDAFVLPNIEYRSKLSDEEYGTLIRLLNKLVCV